MGLTVILSLAGLVPILIDKKLLPIADKKYHPLVGLATLVVAFVQPFIGYFRPSKDHQFRPLFKLFHTFLGYSCILMAIASIFLTNELPVTIWDVEYKKIVFFPLEKVSARLGKLSDDCLLRLARSLPPGHEQLQAGEGGGGADHISR